jgi:hypothetical protein
VTVHNSTQHQYDQSDMGGNFKIVGAVGDTIVFSFSEYRPDTVLVMEDMLIDRYDVFLSPKVTQLATVTIADVNTYALDSMQRRRDYESFYEDHSSTSLLAHQTPTDGVGLTFSPISFLSRKEKRKRALGKRLERDEKQFYINYKFPRNYVAKLTSLTGDSLQLFMVRYRPSYAFCRNASSEDMLIYINDHFKEFCRHRTP